MSMSTEDLKRILEALKGSEEGEDRVTQEQVDDL